MPHLSLPDLSHTHGNILSLKENVDYRMNFVVTSDPSLDTLSRHHLSRQGKPHNENHVFLESNLVIFKKIKKSDAGIYIISSTNVAGQGKVAFLLKVKCENMTVLMSFNLNSLCNISLILCNLVNFYSFP